MYTDNFYLTEALKGIRQGKYTASDLLERALKRIDNCESVIRALLSEENREKRLTERVKKLDKKYRKERALSPQSDLYGVPIGVKDIFHVDKLPTRAGSRIDPELLTAEEGGAVKALRKAGALVLGKTVTTEFAYYAPGPTRNPCNPDHTPGGSSSGSAAAVSAGYCPLALGSQTIGSVIRPAAFCGITGFKPSYERISREGMMDFSPSVDHVGFFTRDVSSIRPAAKVLLSDWKPQKDTGDIHREVKLGIPDTAYLDQAEEEGRHLFHKNIKRLQSTGLEIKELSILENIEEINELHKKLVAREFAVVHRKRYREHGDLFRPESEELLKRGQKVSEEDSKRARKRRLNLRGEISTVIKEKSIDGILSLSAPGPAPEGIDDTGDPVMNLPWTYAGVPVVSIPSAFSEKGLPVGLQIAVPYGEDEKLITLGEKIEKFFGENKKDRQ